MDPKDAQRIVETGSWIYTVSIGVAFAISILVGVGWQLSTVIGVVFLLFAIRHFRMVRRERTG